MPPYKNVASQPSNLKLPDFEILFFELTNHFLHFIWLLDKTMPKLLVTYGITYNVNNNSGVFATLNWAQVSPHHCKLSHLEGQKRKWMLVDLTLKIV